MIEESNSVQETDPHYGDDQAAHSEPEDEDRVVDVSQLPVRLTAVRLYIDETDLSPGDDGNPGSQHRNSQSEAQPYQIVRLLHVVLSLPLHGAV